MFSMKTGMNSMDSLLLCLSASPKWQLPFFLDPRSLWNSAPNPNSSKIPLDFPWIRRVGMEGGQEFGIYSQWESVTPVPLDKGFSMIFHGKKNSFGMCWMGEKAQGHLEFPGVGIWGGKQGWNPSQDP